MWVDGSVCGDNGSYDGSTGVGVLGKGVIMGRVVVIVESGIVAAGTAVDTEIFEANIGEVAGISVV